MKTIATIDCGTTNSRLSLVDEKGTIIHRGSKKIGVKDTAIRGSNEYLKAGLRDLLDEVLAGAGVPISRVDFIISSGMITSELGIAELPHVFAPASMNDLAESITLIDDERNFDPSRPLYLIRGVKNAYDPEKNDIMRAGDLDFMRGEETQAAGLLRLYGAKVPTTVINLSSHTKCIPVDAENRILGCITTLSGQVFEAVVKETSIGKSVQSDDESSSGEEAPFDRDMADLAYDIVTEAGLLRGLMMPRFMDVLLKTTWRQRRTFIESALAADDLASLRLFPKFGFSYGERIFLVGPPGRCEIFTHYLETKLNLSSRVVSLSDPEEVVRLAIHGALYLAGVRGLL